METQFKILYSIMFGCVFVGIISYLYISHENNEAKAEFVVKEFCKCVDSKVKFLDHGFAEYSVICENGESFVFDSSMSMTCYKK